jgi:hypothetical protein
MNDIGLSAAEREFAVMKHFYDKKQLFDGSQEYEGFFSWKFRQKAKTSVESFLQAVKKNHGYDVYLINPFPAEILHWNVWSQGDSCHPGLTYLAMKIFKTAGLSWDPYKTPNIPNTTSFCNFWIANKKFWDLYMSYANKFYDIICNNNELKESMLIPAPGGHMKAPYFSFFYERLLTEIVFHHPEIKVKGFRLPKSWYNAEFSPHAADLLFGMDWNTNIQENPELKKTMDFWLVRDQMFNSKHLFFNYKKHVKLTRGLFHDLKKAKLLKSWISSYGGSEKGLLEKPNLNLE